MSLKKVLREIERFIESDSPEVMAIVGDWGVGKTYTWKKSLIQAKTQKKVFNKTYSYVSLFGVNDVTKLKFMIFENMIGIKHVGEEPSLLTLRDNLLNLNDSDIKKSECTLFVTLVNSLKTPWKTSLLLFRKLQNFFREPGIRICNFLTHIQFYWRKLLRAFFPTLQPVNETIQTLSYASINQTLICFDDLERTSINLKDLLGIVSELKEQKNCKILLIFNDNEVEDRADLDTHNEKVIDIRLAFDIDAKEASSLVFDGKDASYQELCDYTLNLDITNIRILKKICWFYELISPLIEEYEAELKKGIKHSLVLFTLASFNRDENKVPPLAYIEKYGFISQLSEKGETEQKWSDILSDYGYSSTDELDRVIIETVKNGYVDLDKFMKVAGEKNHSIKASSARQSFTDAWKLYHHDLDVNEDELVDALLKSFYENIKHIIPINLDGTVRLFRELGRDNEANEIIEAYVEARRDEPSLFDPNENYMLSDISDTKINQEFKDIYTQNSTKESARDVLQRLAHSNGWNPRDKVVLLNTSRDEFIQIFKEQKQDLSAYIDACLRFGRSVNASEDEMKITAIVKEALTEIAKESRLNELRMKKYGIFLEKIEPQ